MKGRKPIRRESLKHRAERPLRRKVVEVVMRRDGYQCQARALVPDVRCGGPLDPHEIVPRSAWRAGYLEPTNILVVCRNHHRWIDADIAAAHDVGLHGYSWERER